MPDELVVVMDGIVAGRLSRHANNRLRFVYDEDYRASGATPLSLSMPLTAPAHADSPSRRPVTDFLWGLLPDSDTVLERWARHYAVRRTSPFFLLGTPVGEDCAGAVSFWAPDDLERMLGHIGDIEWLTEDDVSALLRDLRSDRAAWLGQGFTGQFSLAGAQAKTALLHDGRRWGRPSGMTPTTHILKPGAGGFADHEVDEHLCLDAARRAGLTTATSRIERFGDQLAIVSTRYDRIHLPDGSVRRVHQEDACQALAMGPDRKYESRGGPGVRAIAGLLRGAMPPAAAEAAVREFAGGLAWNWIIGGTDAHARNYSLLLARDQVRLAPLYDVSSYLPYLEQTGPGQEYLRERDITMAMRIGGSYELSPPRNTWPAAAADLGISADELLTIVRGLAEAAPDAFATAAAAPPVADLGSPLVERLVDRVADRAARCAAVLGTAPGGAGHA